MIIASHNDTYTTQKKKLQLISKATVLLPHHV